MGGQGSLPVSLWNSDPAPFTEGPWIAFPVGTCRNQPESAGNARSLAWSPPTVPIPPALEIELPGGNPTATEHGSADGAGPGVPPGFHGHGGPFSRSQAPVWPLLCPILPSPSEIHLQLFSGDTSGDDAVASRCRLRRLPLHPGAGADGFDDVPRRPDQVVSCILP